MTTTPAPPAPDPTAAQVLLFGHAGAGKSALLGALMQVGEVHGDDLGGQIVEPSGRLEAVRDAVYHGAELQRSDTELTSYTVHLRPRDGGGEAFTVVLNDCSGKAAASLIRHPEALSDARTRAPVARAVIDADAIVLMVNAAADDEQLQEAFEEFDTFLTVVGHAKENAREVGGYPVLLVLTHCDQLARPGDTWEAWEERVNARADRAWTKFDAFLKDAEPDDDIPSPFLPFGSIDLTVYATAVRLPKLRDAPAQPDTPYRVGELFHDCFVAARRHRETATASNRRLKWTVRAALGFVAFLFLGVIAVAILQPKPNDPGLAGLVTSYQLNEPEAAVRLADGNIARNKRALLAFREDSRYFDLPDDLRGFVEGRLREIEDYEAYRAKLAGVVAPADTRSQEQLAETRGLLEGELALPPQYAWGETAAAELRRKWLADAAAIRDAEGRFTDRYRDLVRRGAGLTISPTFAGTWRQDVAALLAEGAAPPAVLADPLPGSPEVGPGRGQAVTNRVPYEFERVYQARRDWETTGEKLSRLRNLADALDLTAAAVPHPLLWPEPGPGVDSAALPAALLAALPREVTQDPDGFRKWQLADFPDPGRGALADRLGRTFQTGARHVHALIRSKLGPNPEQRDTPDGWRVVTDALSASPFPEWGRLLHLVARMQAENAPNPVAELQAFLRQKEFELAPRGFALSIPRNLTLADVRPDGPFTITVTPQGGQPVVLRFKPAGDGERGPAATTFRFTAEAPGGATYRPGDELRAELPVRVGGQEYKLVWENGLSKAYQFDKLAREPRLVKAGGGSEPATGVTLTPTGGPDLPRLPALFPDVRK